MAFDQKKYTRDYNKSNYDRLAVSVPKGMRNEIASYAKTRGVSVNTLVQMALRDCYGFDFSKKSED